MWVRNETRHDIGNTTNLMKRLANAVVDCVLGGCCAGVVELEGRVQQELVGQLLIGHAAGQRSVGTTTTTTATPMDRNDAVGVEPRELLCASDLRKLAAQTLNLSAELDLELGVIGFVVRKLLLGVVECNERVLDATR